MSVQLLLDVKIITTKLYHNLITNIRIDKFPHFRATKVRQTHVVTCLEMWVENIIWHIKRRVLDIKTFYNNSQSA